MTAKQFLDTFIVGQERMKNELEIYMDALITNNLNLLLRGNSGFGKTYISHVIGNYVNNTLSGENYYLYLCYPEMDLIFDDRRIQMLDEVHLITNPEFLYPYMDSNNFSFILSTNEYFRLKEPLVNRCIALEFSEYTKEELGEIAIRFFLKRNIEVPSSYLQSLSNRLSKPREVTVNCTKLFFIFKSKGVPKTQEEFESLLENILGINEEGYTDAEINYIKLLRSLGNASINTLALTLNIPRQVLIEEIEPKLIRKNILRISSKGRILNE